MVNHVKKLNVKAIPERTEEKPKKTDAARAQRGIYFVMDDDRDCEDIMNSAGRNWR